MKGKGRRVSRGFRRASRKFQGLGDFAWQFLDIMGDHDEGLVGTLAEGGDDVADEIAAIGVEAMQGLVEYK